MPDKRLVIIDGYSLLYRAFFATRYLSTADGRPTNALFGFTSMLFHLLENVRPDAIVVALDAPGKTFRHAAYAEYKGTRRETQEELKVQLPLARELITALGIPQKEMTGYEADDVVGTISKLAEENGYDTTIVTGDLDSLQLVDECVSVLTMQRGVTDTVTYNVDRVVDRYGFEPTFIPDYKAIVGDTSDNIPGVPGIGDKGAAQLILDFGTIEQILERFEDLPEKFRKKIEPVRDQMLKSKELATIVRDAPIEYDFKPFVLTAEQMDLARAWMETMEFRSHVRRMSLVLGPYLKGVKKESRPVQVTETPLEVQLLPEGGEPLRAWVGDRPYAVLLEAAPTQASMFDETERGAYVAVEQSVRRVSEADAVDLIAAAPSAAILHDAKPLYKRVGKPLAQPRFDTMLAGYVLQSGRSAYALRDLVQGYLDVSVPTKPEQMAVAIWMLEPAMRDRLGKEGQTRVLDEIEMPLVPILAQMENLGICASSKELQEFSQTLETAIAEVQASIYHHAGRDFNIGSPKQLGEVLFDELQIPGPKKSKTGGYGTGAEILQLLVAEHPICAEVLNWRELTKLKSTYADSLHKLIRTDGRIHTTYTQTGAATGRLSSNDPNLQNIPIRTELGREIRRAFHPAPGYRLASLDYSQIELRVLAHLCGDENLIEAFATHEDVHTVTAALMYNIEADQVSKDQRRYSKMLNYAVSYGVTDFGLAQQLGGDFSVSEARAFIERYFERFPKVKAYMDGVVQEARSKGFTTTICGRRRYFGDIHALNRNERMGAERQAMNAPIQGAAADMMKLAMIGVHRLLQTQDTRMLLTVHDELVFEVPEGGEGAIEPIRQAMESALPLSVPVEVDAKIGQNWRDMTLVPRP